MIPLPHSGVDFRTSSGDAAPSDIFLDVDGDVRFGWDVMWSGYGNTLVPNYFGYDYVLVLHFDPAGNSTYSVFALTPASLLTSVRYWQTQTSNPWQYEPGQGDTPLDGYSGLDIVTYGLMDDAAIGGGLLGGEHYAFSVDLDFLDAGDDFTSHFTFKCGNDSLMGYGSTPSAFPPHDVPDAGSTLLLLGAALSCLALLRKKLI